MKAKKQLLPILILILAATLIFVGCGVDFSKENDNLRTFSPTLIENVNVSASLATDTVATSSEAMYEPDDTVNIMIELNGASYVDYYLANNVNMDINEFIESEKGVQLNEAMSAIQNAFVTVMEEEGIQAVYKHSYKSVFNGVSAFVRFGDLAKIEQLPNVKRIVISTDYSIPDVSEASYEALSAGFADMYSTGILQNNTEYKGDGMLIAVLDTGAETTHSAFATMPDSPALSFEELSRISSGFLSVSAGFSAENMYISEKIPYAFDYAEMDADVVPSMIGILGYGLYHGTHVAGIAAGNDSTIQGSAPNAQLAIMKVFNDNGSANMSDVVAAISDCILLGVDAVNLSLGSPAGFTLERYSAFEFFNDIYRKAENVGILMCVSAGNSYSTSIISTNANLYPSNPDTSSIGSPGSYYASLAIASLNSAPDTIFYFNGEKYSYRNCWDYNAIPYSFADSLLVNDEYTNEIVVIPNWGDTADYANLDVAGKIVLVQRGSLTFSAKVDVAASMGAAACIIYNNTTGTILLSMQTLPIPTISITQESGNKIIAEIANSDENEFLLNNDVSYSMSPFSSWGPLSDLSLKPDLTAPGGAIYSAVPYIYNPSGYTSLDGTSMASPNLAGIALSLKQYLEACYPQYTNAQIQDMVYQILMSTADVVFDGNGNPYSPRKQGAGMVNINSAVSTQAYLSVTGSDRTKLSLGDDKNKDGIYTLNFNLVNISAEAHTYNISYSTITESINSLGFTAEMAYLLSDCDYTVKVTNGTYTDGKVTVQAGEAAQITIIITLTEDSKVYLDSHFSNGIYVEGFVFFECDDSEHPTLSIPWMAFYGDWTAAPVFDYTIYDEETPFIYGTRVYSVYNNMYQVQLGAYSTFALPAGYAQPQPSYDNIAVSDSLFATNRIMTIQLTLLRNVTRLDYMFKDAVTGQIYAWIYAVNVSKVFYNNGQIVVTQHVLDVYTSDFTLSNNQQLIIEIQGELDYEGETKIQSIEIPLFIDLELPTMVNAAISEENDRTYLEMEVFDNHSIQNFSLLTNDATGAIVLAHSYAFPVYEWKNGLNNTIRFDITDYLPMLYNGELYIQLQDYAYNAATYYVGNVNQTNDTNAIPNTSSKNTELSIKNSADGSIMNIEIETPVEIGIHSTIREGDAEYVVQNGVLTDYIGPGGYIIIPDNLGIKEIGSQLFYNLPGITGIEIPEGVTRINNHAFYMCSDLTTVKLPTTMEYIGESAFLNCSLLSDLDLSKTNISFYGRSCFAYCFGLKELELPCPTTNDGYATILDTSFIVLLGMEKITINCKFDILENNTFTVMPNLKELIFNNDFNRIEGTNFAAHTNLTKLEFNGDVGYIGANALFPSTSFGLLTSLKEIHFKGDVGEISSIVFSGCYALEKMVFYGKVGTISGLAFGGNTNLKSFTISDDNTDMIYDEVTGILYNADKTKFFTPSNWDYAGEIVLPDTIEELQPFAFSFAERHFTSYVYQLIQGPGYYACIVNSSYPEYSGSKMGITSITLPSHINHAPQAAFRYLSNLKSINGTQLERIDLRAFDYCLSLTEIDLSQTTSIGAYAFNTCAALKNANLPQIEVLGEGAFFNCFNVTEINLSDKISIIPSQCFENTGLMTQSTGGMTVEIPSSVKMISYNAFSNCPISTLILNEGLETVASGAFNLCLFTEITFPASLVSIDPATALSNCRNLQNIFVAEGNPIYASYNGILYNASMTQLLNYPMAKPDTEITLADTAVLIGENVFKNNTILQTINMLSVVEIGASAFENSVIVNVNSSAKLEVINDYAFKGAVSLTNIDISGVTYIGVEAFSTALQLKRVTLPNTLEFIGDYAFRQCYGLNELIISEGVQEFDYNFVFFDAPFIKITLAEGNTAFKMVDGILYNYNGTILYYGSSTLETENLVIPEGVLKIGARAFMFNNSIKTLTLPSTLKIVGDKAFFQCMSISDIHFLSEKAPSLEGLNIGTPLYGNFINYLGSIAPNTLSIHHPLDESYTTYIWESYFDTRYLVTANGEQRLEANVSDVINMISNLKNYSGNTLALKVEEALKEYSLLNDSMKPFVHNSDELQNYTLTNVSSTALSLGCNGSIESSAAFGIMIVLLTVFAVVIITKKKSDSKH